MDSKISINILKKFSASPLSGLDRMIRWMTSSSTIYYLSFFNENQNLLIGDEIFQYAVFFGFVFTTTQKRKGQGD
jgi:hypothetical protein